MISQEVADVVATVGPRIEELQRQCEEKWREPVMGDHRAASPEMDCHRLVIEADAASVLTVRGKGHKKRKGRRILMERQSIMRGSVLL